MIKETVIVVENGVKKRIVIEIPDTNDFIIDEGDSPIKTKITIPNIHAPHSDDQDLREYVKTDDPRLIAGPGGYVHPAYHPAYMISESVERKFVTASELLQIHAPNSDDQDLSGLVVKETGKSLVGDSLISQIHAAGSDNQDLSGLQPKETGKGLSTNDYTTAEQSKLAGLSNYTHPANHAPSIITQDVSNRFVSDTEKGTWNGKSNLTLGDLAANAYQGDKGKTAYDHSQITHAPSNAQKNSDITKAEIEAKLTGAITTHTHAAVSPTWKCGIATKNITDASTVQNIPHGLGRIPTIVRIDGAVIISAAITQTCTGIYDGTNNSGLSVCTGEGSTTAATDAVYTSTSIALGFSPLVATNPFTGTNRQTGVITVNATNIIITWTKTGTVASLTASLLWQCT